MQLQSFPVMAALVLASALAGAASPPFATDPLAPSRARQQLHQQQLQDQLSLQLQQDLARSRPGLSGADRQRLESLALGQRLEQERLQQEQQIQLRRFANDPDRLRLEQRRYDQAREVQLQQFYVEQQRLLGSMRSQPLQPVPPPGQLVLP